MKHPLNISAKIFFPSHEADADPVITSMRGKEEKTLRKNITAILSGKDEQQGLEAFVIIEYTLSVSIELAHVIVDAFPAVSLSVIANFLTEAIKAGLKKYPPAETNREDFRSLPAAGEDQDKMAQKLAEVISDNGAQLIVGDRIITSQQDLESALLQIIKNNQEDSCQNGQ